MQVAEIAVRFGDTLLETRQLDTGTFRVGHGRDTDLAVVGLTSFPLVDWTDRGCLVRIPAGFRAQRFIDDTALPLDGPLVLGRGDRIALSIGGATIEIALVTRAAPLARAPIDTRWPRWIAGTLVAHLLALAAIFGLAEPEPEGVRVASIISLLPRLPEPEIPQPAAGTQARQKPRRDPNRLKPQTRIAADTEVVHELAPGTGTQQVAIAERRRKRAVQSARGAGILGGITAEDIKKITGTKDIQKELADAKLYRDYEVTTGQFGNGRHFEGAPTVAVGRYATISSGRGAGDYYVMRREFGVERPPTVQHCTGECTATGGLHRDVVTSNIARYNEAILGCYDRGGGKKPGSVVIEVTIGDDGKVVTSDGEGLGRTGACVAGVIRRVKFPKAEPTSVRYPMSFEPGKRDQE